MKKRALTLLEVMIVIFLITLITGTIGYSMRGTLDKGFFGEELHVRLVGFEQNLGGISHYWCGLSFCRAFSVGRGFAIQEQIKAVGLVVIQVNKWRIFFNKLFWWGHQVDQAVLLNHARVFFYSL